MSNAADIASGTVSETEVQRRLDFAAAALGAAGHEVTDPFLQEVARQYARGEITLEEAGRLGDRHILDC